MTTPSEPEDRASLEAARWLVALEDAPDDTEIRTRIDAWRAASPQNEAAWLDTCAVYDLMAGMAPQHRPLRDDRVASPATHARPARHWRRAAIGAAAALAACILIVVGPGLLLRIQADQWTSTAEVRSIGLDDGSVVRMAPDSAVDVAYETGRRRVRLLRGEAFFEVRPDPARPFVVEARGVQTAVLGTSFNVRASADGAEIAVRSGLVRVDGAAARPPVTLRLQPGEWAQVARSGVVARGRMPADEVAPWLVGQLVARDRPMAEVIDDLRRYFPGSIVIVDTNLAARHVTGVYNLADPVGALRAIVGAHGGSVRLVSPWLLLVL